jgi:hypothetical protein
MTIAHPRIPPRLSLLFLLVAEAGGNFCSHPSADPAAAQFGRPHANVADASA